MKYVEALPYLEKSGNGLMNGPNNEGAILLVEELEDLGCKVKVELEDDSDEDDDDDGFDAVLFVTLPSNIDPEIIVLIARAHPDETSEEEPGVLRLWWD